MMEQKGYAGKIRNSGAQVVQAPAQKAERKKGVVKRGKDLRSGK